MSTQLSLIDTHCHIHDAAFSEKFRDKDPAVMIEEARDAGVHTLICVGTDLSSSQQAVAFCQKSDACYSSVALHPHEAEHMTTEDIDSAINELTELVAGKPERLVAIGECGLDYFYHQDLEDIARQKHMLKGHLAIAQQHRLPVIFHVRDAFEDFFEIFDQFSGIRGVVHSFSATDKELKAILSRDLYIGLNGIMTFTKNDEQLNAARSAPLDNIVLETDAPFLTPAPLRGKMCEPKHIRVTAEFIAQLRGEGLEAFANATTRNARRLFGL